MDYYENRHLLAVGQVFRTGTGEVVRLVSQIDELLWAVAYRESDGSWGLQVPMSPRAFNERLIDMETDECLSDMATEPAPPMTAAAGTSPAPTKAKQVRRK